MTPDERVTIFRYLRAGQPGNTTDDMARLWDEVLAPLTYRTATRAAERCVRERERLTVAGFLELYRAEVRAEVPPPALMPAAPSAQERVEGLVAARALRLMAQGAGWSDDGPPDHDHSRGWSMCPRCGEVASRMRNERCKALAREMLASEQEATESDTVTL